MAKCKLVRRNYDGKLLVSIKYQNLHYFKEGLILLCQSILAERRITHFHGSALFTIPLSYVILKFAMYGFHFKIVNLTFRTAVVYPYQKQFKKDLLNRKQPDVKKLITENFLKSYLER